MEKLHYTEDQVMKMPFISICNWLSYFKEMDDHINQMNNKNTLTT